MKNSLLLVGVITLTFLTFSACKKTTEDGITEPITLVSPDSTTISNKAGKVQAIEIKFTTDRPINYAQALYEIDTTLDPSHIYKYPDTFFYKNFDTLGTTPNNKYTYSGGYTIPDTLEVGHKIRFKAQFKADKLVYQKEFLIKVAR